MTRSQRYAAHLRLSSNKAACVRKIVDLTKELKVLPCNVSEAFDSAFGLDKNLEGFLQSNYALDLSADPNKDQLIKDLLDGTYESNNPVLKLPNGDLIADQIATYASVSQQIREAFDIDLDEAISASEMLPVSDDFYQQKQYCAPIFSSLDDVFEGMHLQVDVSSSMFNVNNTNVFSRTFTSELKDVRVTMFENGDPVGLLTASLISFSDEALYQNNFESKTVISKAHNGLSDAVLMTDIDSYDPSLSGIISDLSHIARTRSLSVKQNPHLSIATGFVIPNEVREGKNGILHVRDVDISDSHKAKLHNILETLCVLFSDHGNYDVETYTHISKGFNSLLWASNEDDENVAKKREAFNKEWSLSGISAITTIEGCNWWHESISQFMPDDEEILKPLVYVENNRSDTASVGFNKAVSIRIEDLLKEASVKDFDSSNYH